MTPSQLEHLKLIDAHLERLLALAEKRTPGEWIVGWNMVGDGISKSICNAPMMNEQTTTIEWVSDKRFIASCAGNAEAGWRATRAAVKSLLEIEKFLSSVSYSDSTVRTVTLIQEALLPHILATFPLELIKEKTNP